MFVGNKTNSNPKPRRGEIIFFNNRWELIVKLLSTGTG